MNSRFHFLRTERFKTIQSLADKSGITRSTLSAIENGRMNVSTNHVEPLCKCFEVTADFLLERSNDGIKLHYKNSYSEGHLIISMEQYIKFQSFIKIEAGQRIIFGDGIEDIKNEQLGSNRKLLESYSSVFIGDSFSKEILNYLPKLSVEQKQMILSIIKSWGK